MPRVSEGTFDGATFEHSFPPEFYNQLAGYFRIPLNPENAQAIRQGHYDAYYAHFIGQLRVQKFVAEKAENAKLEAVARNAENLFHALIELFEHGETQEKLAQQIQNNPTEHVGPDGLRLAGLLNQQRRDNPFYDLNELISDLRISAKRAVNKKPPKEPETATLQRLAKDKKLPTEEEFLKLIDAKDYFQSIDSEANHARWKARNEAHRLPRNYALVCFVAAFEPTWVSLSGRAVSEGYNDRETDTPTHDSIEAIKLCMDQVGETYTHQQIATAIRVYREGHKNHS